MTNSATQPFRALARSIWFDLAGVFCIFLIYANYMVPAINEPHYWTKAAHFWDSSFGKGDLFLESGDAHWLFFATFGYLTQWIPISYAVWTGRILVWITLASSWTILARSLWVVDRNSAPDKQCIPLTGTLWGIIWLCGMHWGHWAGEWVIGGCESKGVAYAFIFLGLAMAIRQRWTFAWTFLGIASAFHVVTGIWVILCVASVSFFLDFTEKASRQLGICAQVRVHFGQWLRTNVPGWTVCFIGVLIGALPALLIDWNAAPSVATESAVKQAYLRLGHHLVPTRFSPERWRWFGGELLIAMFLLLAMAFSKPFPKADQLSCEAEPAKYLPNLFWSMAMDWRQTFQSLPRGIQFIVGSGLFAFFVAMIGLAIDLTFSTRQPEIAAKILRFYWFRWNDVAMPMMIGAVAIAFGSGWVVHQSKPKRMQWLVWFAILIPGALLLYERLDGAFKETIPAGDKAHLIVKTDSPEDQQKHYRDWLAVCQWIRENTDKEGLWLTPRRQQSFKWHTGRAELACWKDAPQNAVALVEWGSRLADAFQFNDQKILQPWTEQKLLDLRTQYGIRYVLLDRRVLRQSSLLLPMLYPTEDHSNSTFAVFEFQDSNPAPANHLTTKP